jgi:hypothetical protein
MDLMILMGSPRVHHMENPPETLALDEEAR